MISTFGWICICFFLLIIKYVFLQPVEDKRLYRLYEARDNVALAAVEGKISQEADEYKFVIQSINTAIFYMKNNYDFSILINNILFQPEKAEQYFNHMIELIERYDFLEANYSISGECFKRSIIIRLFFFVHLVINPFYHALNVLLAMIKLGKKITEYSIGLTQATQKRINIIVEIQNMYDDYQKGFAK